MVTIQDLRSSKCTDRILQHATSSHTNETPGEWKERIWARLTYFRENDLLPDQSKRYLEARKLIRFPDGGSYAPEIGIAIRSVSIYWTKKEEYRKL